MAAVAAVAAVAAAALAAAAEEQPLLFKLPPASMSGSMLGLGR